MRRPDGDVELQQTDFSSFAVPPCQRTPQKQNAIHLTGWC